MLRVNRLLLVSIVISVSGCCVLQSDRTAFKKALDYWVGSELSAPWYEDFVGTAASTESLGDHISEYYYVSGECEYAVQINDQSREFLSWAYKGDPAACKTNSCGAW
jgi:hypothetical protein